MQHRKKVIAGIITMLMALAGFVVLAAPVAALARALRFWAYPVFFGLNMLLSCIVLVIVLPASGKRGAVWPWLRHKLSVLEAKLAEGRWAWIMKRGAFLFVLLSTIVISPLAGAVAIRMLGIREDRAWAFAFAANLISTLIWISMYIGVIDSIKSAFSSLVAH